MPEKEKRQKERRKKTHWKRTLSQRVNAHTEKK